MIVDFLLLFILTMLLMLALLFIFVLAARSGGVSSLFFYLLAHQQSKIQLDILPQLQYIMQKEKVKNEEEKLADAYSQWEDFARKSKIKMRKKIKKDKTEYYDFDYTRGQYYYHYPHNHPSFAPPSTQLTFFKNLLSQQSQDITSSIIDQHEPQSPIEQHLNPLELNTFLRNLNNKLHNKIAALRIRKTLFIRQNTLEKEYTNLMEAEIRSFFYRYQKLSNIFFNFNKPLAERLESIKCNLKLKQFDQMHFSQLQKGDFVVYLRMENVRQRVEFDLDCLQKETLLLATLKKCQIRGRCYQKRAEAIKALETKHAQKFKWRREKIEYHFKQSYPQFLENDDNLQKIQQYLSNLNFIHMFLQHRKSSGKHYLDGSKLLTELQYIPFNNEELKHMLFQVCRHYFPKDMLQDLYEHRRQNLCFRLNYFVSILLRTMSESNNFLVEIREKDLLQYKNAMLRELQTMFTNDVTRLFNLPEYQIITLVNQGPYLPKDVSLPPASQSETIFREYFKQNNITQPICKSIFALLDSYSQKSMVVLAEQQARAVIIRSKSKLKQQALYYRNVQADQKSHLISIVNAKMLLGIFEENVIADKLDQIFWQGQLDYNLIRTTYLMQLTRSCHLKRHLDHVVSAQVAIMYKLKYRLELLKYKNDMPFEMTQQFITRFTDSSHMPQPFDFLKETEQSRKDDYPDPQLHDKIVRFPEEQRVEVRRMMPQNPLFEGKQILYREALSETSKILDKLHQTCAFLIERRQNFLNEQAFSGVVDRFVLVGQLIQAELNYQLAKLDYLQELCCMMEMTIDPEGLHIINNLLVQTKASEVFLSFSQFHCLQEYKDRAEIFRSEARILNTILRRQKAAEEKQAQQFRQSAIKHNHTNNIPEISSLYYCDELPMEVEDNIIEAQDQSYSEIDESQSMTNSKILKSDFSGLSSDYHVKTTFKQILGRAALNAVGSQNNRRQELMGRKKKILINDSILGGLLSYKNCKTYFHIHKCAQFMTSLTEQMNDLFRKKDSGIEKEYYAQIESVINNSERKTLSQQLVNESMLYRVMGDANRAVNKVVEKIKIAPSSIDQYLFMNVNIAKNLLTGQSGVEVNSIRGLYTCLNLVQLSQLNYSLFLLDHQQQTIVGRQIQKILKTYSTQHIPAEALYLSGGHLIERDMFPSQFKLQEHLVKTRQSALQFLGEYSTYTRFSYLINHSYLQYYTNTLFFLSEQVGEYQLLKIELQAMENYGCYFAVNEQLLKIPGIEDKMFVRKKKDFVNYYQSRLFSFSFVKDALELPKSKIASFRIFHRVELVDEKSLIENMNIFHEFMLQLGVLAVQMNIAGQQVFLNLKEKQEVKVLQQLTQLLPYLNQQLKITLHSTLLKDTFAEYYQHLSSLQKDHLKVETSNQPMEIEYHRPSFAAFNRTYPKFQVEKLKNVIRKATCRSYPQFGSNQSNKQEKFYHHLHLTSYQPPLKLNQNTTLQDFYDFRETYLQALRMRMWIQSKIICFGLTLNKSQLLQLRMILVNPENNLGIFWMSENTQLLRHTDLVKMRYDVADEATIKDQYTLRYVTYQNLKNKYKQFLDNLADLDFKNEGLQNLGLFFIAEKKLFEPVNAHMPQYLKDYCFIKTIKNKISQFIEYSALTNPNRTLLKTNKFTLERLKAYMWDPQELPRFRQTIATLDERCATIKQILNFSNSKMNDMRGQFTSQIYKGQRMLQFMTFLEIHQTPKTKLEYNQFLKKFQEDLLLDKDKLTPSEKFLSKFMDKIVRDKPELLSIKDEVLDKIYESRFRERLILDELARLSRMTLQEQCRLNEILHENYSQKEKMRENKIIKATLNKVLVPKIILNPYLQSPLQPDNYFFAASLKLSYLDAFLNRLKNRAIMVELAEGGFGFLLKVPELDECIQHLCKGMITFTQKQFNDRLRTYFESYDELYQKYRKLEIQNQHFKDIVSLSQNQRGKELQSLLYSKLDSYLITMNSKQKTYESVFNLVKSLETEIREKVDQEYQDRIKQLEKENNKIKDDFASFRLMLNQNTHQSMQQSKQLLCNTFKKDVEGILMKEVFKKHSASEIPYSQQKQMITDHLLNRLRTQKFFYEMRLSALEDKVISKTEEINKLTHQLTTLQNTLTLEQFKNNKVSDQIREMHLKNIKVEELKKEIAKREEQEALNKFKLIKINENLQGKISRLEEKKRTEGVITQFYSGLMKNNQGVQTTEVKESRPTRNFRIKTEQPQMLTSTLSQGQFDKEKIWRQKWEYSERKYQLLMTKILSAYENYQVSKNLGRLVDRVHKIVEECNNNRVMRKPIN